MSYITKKAVETYFDTLLTYDIKEKDITKVEKKGNIIMVETLNKLFLKTIKR